MLTLRPDLPAELRRAQVLTVTAVAPCGGTLVVTSETEHTGGVPGCCDPRGYDAVFDDRFARRVARRFRKRGLSRAQRRMVDFIVASGVDGASVLEIGGGVGELQVELLRRGAGRATNLELSQGYEHEAARLIDEAGLTGRVTRHHLDIVEAPDQVEPADIVILHRVVCCYPDAARLLSAAGGHAKRILVLSHPPAHRPARAFVALTNFGMSVTGRTYRAFAHPPELMEEVLRDQGLVPVLRHRGPVWHVLGFTR